MIKRIAAHFVFPVSSPPFAKGIIEVDQDGTVVRLIRTEGKLLEMAGMEFHNGILCPAFVDVFHEFSPVTLFKHLHQLVDFQSAMPEITMGYQGILEWMKAIQSANSKVSLENLIRLFSLEPAKVLGRQNDLGTLDPGKHPGILLIDRMDYRNLRLSRDSRVKRLI